MEMMKIRNIVYHRILPVGNVSRAASF